MKVETILVSQPEPKNGVSPYFDLSAKYKVKIDFRPFIHIKAIPTKKVREKRLDLNTFTGIILTSRNAVDYFFKISEEMYFKVPEKMRYFCLSEAVGSYLQKYVMYRKRKIYVGDNTLTGLTKIIKKHRTEKFLLPSSDKLKPLISKELDKTQIDWTRLDLYETVVSDLSDLKTVFYDILVFFSPSGIKSLFENFPNFKKGKTKIAAFGNSTVEAVEEAGLTCDIQAPTPVTPSMTMAIEKYLKVANKKPPVRKNVKAKIL